MSWKFEKIDFAQTRDLEKRDHLLQQEKATYDKAMQLLTNPHIRARLIGVLVALHLDGKLGFATDSNHNWVYVAQNPKYKINLLISQIANSGIVNPEKVNATFAGTLFDYFLLTLKPSGENTE